MVNIEFLQTPTFFFLLLYVLESVQYRNDSYVRQYAKTAGALPKIMSYDIILQSTVTK